MKIAKSDLEALIESLLAEFAPGSGLPVDRVNRITISRDEGVIIYNYSGVNDGIEKWVKPE